MSRPPAVRLPTVEPEGALDRRAFFERSVRLAAVAILAGACSDLTSITGPELTESVTVRLVDYPALDAVGGVVRITGVSVPIALSHLGDGVYEALSLVCTHQGATVQWTGTEFRCPQHGARFAADGHWIGGQQTTGLLQYPTTYDAASGTVTIEPRA